MSNLTSPPIAEAPDPQPSWPVWGHAEAVRGLRREMANQRVRHAYVLDGPGGVGKTTLALAFAQALCCQAARSDPSVPCGACHGCRKIVRGVHPDVTTFSLASQAATAERKGSMHTSLSIETVRQVASATALRPVEAAWRVVIVEDAETMAGVAQEALLKTLEEPPSYTVLLLLCDDAALLLPTVRSRCQTVTMRLVHRSEIVSGLVAGGLPREAAEEIANLAGGLPGWARRAAADSSMVAARRAGVDRAVTWIGSPSYDRLVAAVRLADAFTKRRTEVVEELVTLLGVWRDLLLVRAEQHTYLTHSGIADRLAELARGWTLADLHQAIRAVQTGLADLESNVRPRLALEAMVLQWPTPPSAQ